MGCLLWKDNVAVIDTSAFAILPDAGVFAVSCLFVCACVCGNTSTCITDPPAGQVYLLFMYASRMIINPIIKHLLPAAPALPFFRWPLGTQSHHHMKPEDRKRGGRAEGGGRARRSEGWWEGWGKKSSDSGGSSDSQILSHQRGVIVQKDKRVWSYVTPEQRTEDQDEFNTFHKRRTTEGWKRGAPPSLRHPHPALTTNEKSSSSASMDFYCHFHATPIVSNRTQLRK